VCPNEFVKDVPCVIYFLLSADNDAVLLFSLKHDTNVLITSAIPQMEELKAQYQQSSAEVLALKESLVKLRREAVIAREFRDENMRLEDELARFEP
jgi:hypothetical protein